MNIAKLRHLVLASTVLLSSVSAFAQAASVSTANVDLVPADITQLFPKAGAPANIAFRPVYREIPKPEGALSITYQLINYDGRTIANGEAAADERGLFIIRTTLAEGYYEISFGDAGKSVGIWSVPRNNIPDDGFYSLDTAMSWLTQPEMRPALVKNLKHVLASGGMARERMHWGHINPAQGKWEWETPKAYDSLRRLYSKSGIKILEMFHDAPGWLGRQSAGFPDNLVESDRSWREIARRWHDTWGAIEAWNEADANSGRQPADQLAPILKVLRHALRTENISTPVGGGVFAGPYPIWTGPNPDYLNLAAENGLLDECDFLSFHYYYEDPLVLEDQVRKFRNWMRAFGHEKKPIWLTETGALRYKETPGVRPTLQAQSRKSLIYAMQVVEARACGVERIFPFVYTDYNEGRSTLFFGMLDKGNTPLRILAASAQAGRMLSGMEYIGDISEKLVPGVRKIRIFAPVSSMEKNAPVLVVLYTDDISSGAKITLPFATKSAQGIDGRNLKLEDNGKTVPAPDGMVYLRVSTKEIAQLVNTDTGAMKLCLLAKASSLPPSPVVADIVLQPKIARGQYAKVSSRGYVLKEDQEHFTVSAGINNLGDTTRTVTLETGLSNVSIAPVTVAANTRIEVPVDVAIADLPALRWGDPRHRLLTINAVADNGARIAPLALALIPSEPEKMIETWLEKFPYHVELDVGNVALWQSDTHLADGVVYHKMD
ncbi:MAG: glycoside hydrolase family protein, partial [Opitutaceae bacterium]|nr:glycoside hydrolase family protein [Opitutaceae bacterium]